ncbi:mitogen-activated protein kinase kinase kinase 21-like [Phoenix dactylifera]|uniref:non-specific serine/threonine protein kinase n=1 Tax=Phoenix dactylifera TaxID=42345 RepID=A0A8B9AW65_PHODC|nr:mitogen-activated protein kinase kinase kinase 21-like [Phoenix dactylifera]
MVASAGGAEAAKGGRHAAELGGGTGEAALKGGGAACGRRRRTEAFNLSFMEYMENYQYENLLAQSNKIDCKPNASLFNEREGEELKLPLFDLFTIESATDCFSINNKLGEGGFGPVYKLGQLEDGQEVAVKRLSMYSVQGLDQFKNEVVLIAKLQHRNLVRLLGCCIQGEERLLIYQYMQNKSSDSFIFDKMKGAMLNWQKCLDIIIGVARRLLYFHQDSRLKIIHRDPKASNVLLDMDMTPKISDFGIARIFQGDQNQENTWKLVGTFGYMSPEYAMDGIFSIKSDVFSFSILILEILSEESEDRATMAEVVMMLSNESVALPQPKWPSFCIARTLMDRDSSFTEEHSVTANEIMVTILEEMGFGPDEVESSLSGEELELIRSRFFFQPGFRLKTTGPEDRHVHEVDTLVFIAQGCQEETRRLSRQLEPAQKRVAELEVALAEAEARREATEAGRLAIVEELEEERAAHSLAKSALRASEVRLAETQSEVAGLKYEGGVLRLKIGKLEAREKRALERAEHAVDFFKDSDEFRDMLEEETVDGFLHGFDNFRRQMARYCPQLDLSTIRPRMGLSADSDDDVSAALASEEESAETEADAAAPAGMEAPCGGITEDAPEAPAEVPVASSEPALTEGPQVIAIDDPGSDAGGTAAP